MGYKNIKTQKTPVEGVIFAALDGLVRGLIAPARRSGKDYLSDDVQRPRPFAERERLAGLDGQRQRLLRNHRHPGSQDVREENRVSRRLLQ